MNNPVIGITVDNLKNTAETGKYESSIAYSRAVAAHGGTPILLPHEVDRVGEYIELCDGFILTGGVDPDVRLFGQELHDSARVMDSLRQMFETQLLKRLAEQRHVPVMGVCLGMQLMALVSGGSLHQYLPEVMDNAEAHQQNRTHSVAINSDAPGIFKGLTFDAVTSYHQQAVAEAGALAVVGKAPDGVVEAIADPGRSCYFGVQWHPERSSDAMESDSLIARFVRACSN